MVGEKFRTERDEERRIEWAIFHSKQCNRKLTRFSTINREIKKQYLKEMKGEKLQRNFTSDKNIFAIQTR